ncbi:pyrroline-5-carboxylate reductase [Trueperella sp. LYQ141]|uniref:pyrroline-5-carboxylate reductase n=1 Tax=Trueperella sp. LYQ141 TaxID=3391058 RepID=UPI00398390E1
MLGFIGMGNMNGALLRGILAAHIVDPDEVVFTRINHRAGAELAAKYAVHYVESIAELAQRLRPGDTCIVGVKPHAMASALTDLGSAARDLVIVSIAAGTPCATLARALPAGTPIVRAMPNVNAQIGQAMTAWYATEEVCASAREYVAELFSAVGRTIELPEAAFPVFSAIAGCSPAWTYTYIDALAQAALAAGLPIHQAREIAAQAVAGSAQLVLSAAQERTPGQLRDEVCSPGGTTIAGLLAMEEAGFTPAVARAVAAAIKRDEDIAAKQG